MYQKVIFRIAVMVITLAVGTIALTACNSGNSNKNSSAVQSSSNASSVVCKHGNYTLKTSYKTYQEAQTDYNMLLNYLKEHDSDECTRDPAVTKKLKNDIVRIKEILKGLPVPSVVMTNEKKLDAINYRIENFYEILQWEGGDQDEETRRLYEQAQGYKKQYENNQISLNTYYEKVMALKYQ